ncbi:DICT sensory domain-containing protein [Haloquadratum walsbyi]|jgi:hypothetical protein|uniref:DICT domain protein n=1 Tax=Haloquadratum walsbyi (strain DSM 16790 / HBSQ001) TaxID=362976 RepID=Q18FV3_HALWD|nr:DICT sensory domain-containing protein [Haloquadratum walsbyi]CAJ53152.1 DICT domain protein [Haloquadratum walsbyi DSM 16790]
MRLRDFVEEFATASDDHSLAVINSDQPPTVTRMLDGLFSNQPVDIETVNRALAEEDVIQLRRDGHIVAESRFSDLRDAILAVNADIYTTGVRSLADIETPAVIRDLERIKFHVRGYPAASKGKLLLIEISRYIESLAAEVGVGELHAGFQRLSRLTHERGTRRAYDELVQTDLSIHVYGTGQLDIPTSWHLTVHADDASELQRGWFVIFDPPADTQIAGAALIAYSIDLKQNEWVGAWTSDANSISRLRSYLTTTYNSSMD